MVSQIRARVLTWRRLLAWLLACRLDTRVESCARRGRKRRVSTRQPERVAVGTAITERPPHSPVLARLTHTVPALDVWRRSARLDTDAGPRSPVARLRVAP